MHKYFHQHWLKSGFFNYSSVSANLLFFFVVVVLVLYMKMGSRVLNDPLWMQQRKRLWVHKATTLSYTHMLLLLSSSHLWSGCDHPIHQICQIDLFLLTGHVLGDEICFMNSFCCVARLCYTVGSFPLPTQW